MAPLPPCQQRYLFLRYQGLEYTDEDIADFEERLERIYSRQIHRGRLFDTRGPLVRELILEFFITLRLGEVLLDLDAPGTIQEKMKSLGFSRFAAGRKSGAHISGGQFVARLAEHFGLLTAEILGGLTVIAPKLSIIDIGSRGTFQRSSPAVFQRRTRQRTGEASTSAAQQDPLQPDL
ncbi:hypothetical protein Tco_1000124, partial [Tanacetum coccineum]